MTEPDTPLDINDPPASPVVEQGPQPGRAGRRIKRARWWVLFAFPLLTTARVAGDSTTNLDLVVNAATEAVLKGLSDLDSLASQLQGGTSVVLRPQEDHEANWIIEHRLAQELLSRGFAVRVDSAGDAGAGTELSFRIIDLVVTGASGLFGSEVERRGRLTLALRLTAESELRWQTEVRGEIADRIPKSRLEAMQNTGYGFADTQLEEKNWGKFVEPVIVTTVLGSLVYVFFSNR